MKNKTRFILLLAFLLFAFTMTDCTYRPKSAETPTVPAVAASPEATPGETRPAYTVTYVLDGETIGTETVTEGDRAAEIPSMAGDRGIVRWKNANGTETNAWTVPIFADTVFEAVPGPELHRTGAYIAPESDGLFHPLNTFTRSDAARAVYNLMVTKPTGETFLKDVTTRARCYESATSLVTQGYMTLDNGHFYPDVSISRADLTSLLGKLFSPGAVEKAMEDVPEPMNRVQAAGVFNRLLGLESVTDMPYYPDVSPQMEGYADVELAGIQGDLSWVRGERAEPGFVNLKGYLYCVDEDGYFLRDTMKGTLYFDAACRYTSGDEALDKYVADLIDSQIKGSLSRDDMLRAAYVYVRDHYLYLKRSIYRVGETGWEIPEALIMFQTGKGNCYNFTGAFWAMARGLGYDAVCYSGLVGVGRDPHSWTEIEFDGVPYVFDVETEMSCRLQDDYISNLYKMSYEQATLWSYAKVPYDDEPETGAAA